MLKFVLRKVMTTSFPVRRVALVFGAGWDFLESRVHFNRDAEAFESTVIFAHRKRMDLNRPMELMIAALHHKTDDSEWMEEEVVD